MVKQENFVSSDGENLAPGYVESIIAIHNGDGGAHAEKFGAQEKVLLQHVEDNGAHVTKDERAKWNNVAEDVKKVLVLAEAAEESAAESAGSAREMAQAAAGSASVAKYAMDAAMASRDHAEKYAADSQAAAGIAMTVVREALERAESSAETLKGFNPDKVKGYIPLSEIYDSATNKTTIVLTSVEGLEVGNHIAKYIVAEPTPKWQSREILSIDTTINTIITHAKFDTQISGALNENSSLEDGILVYGDCTKGVIDIRYSEDMALVKAYVDGDYNMYGFNTTVEGNNNKGLAISSHTEGNRNVTTGISSHNEGAKNTVSGPNAHGEGYSNKVAAENSHGEGAANTLTVEAKYAHVEGYKNTVSGYVAHGEGINNIVAGYCAHGEGYKNEVSNDYAHVEGWKNTVSGRAAHSEGIDNNVVEQGAHAEGAHNTVSNKYAHGEGYSNIVAAENAHGEGAINTLTVEAKYAHVEGYKNTVSGYVAHGEGINNIVTGYCAHIEGYDNRAYGNHQHVQGRFNVADTQHKYAHILGGGTSEKNRKNIHTIDWNGNAEFAGDVRVGSNKKIVATVPDVFNNTPATLVENSIYDLGVQTSLTLNLPSSTIGNFIQVDFLSGSTPTTITITSASGLSDYDLTPEANMIYSLYFGWGVLYYDANTSTYVYGWRFAYSEYSVSEV